MSSVMSCSDAKYSLHNSIRWDEQSSRHARQMPPEAMQKNAWRESSDMLLHKCYPSAARSGFPCERSIKTTESFDVQPVCICSIICSICMESYAHMHTCSHACMHEECIFGRTSEWVANEGVLSGRRHKGKSGSGLRRGSGCHNS